MKRMRASGRICIAGTARVVAAALACVLTIVLIPAVSLAATLPASQGPPSPWRAQRAPPTATSTVIARTLPAAHASTPLGEVGRAQAAKPPSTDRWGHHYSAFGKLKPPDAGTPSPATIHAPLLDQPLRWQGRWYLDIAGGAYDFRARVWSPELGGFLQADELGFATQRATLWSWPNQNPIRLADPSGRTAMRSDELFNWLTSGNFGLGFSMYAKGMERRRQGIMNIPSTQGASLTDVACGTLQMNVGLAVIGEEAQIAAAAAGGLPGIVRLAMLSRAAARGGSTTLYRAVSEAEYAQLMKTGRFAQGPNSLGGKFFAESAADAAKWGEKLQGPGKFRIIEAELPTSAADKLMRWERLDAIGPARYGELEQLTDAVIRGVK